MPSKSQKKRSLSRTVGEVLLISACVGLVYWVVAKQHDSFQPVAMADLKGVWTSPHPKYKDRFLQFDEDTITFGRGADGNGSYTIEKIDCQADTDGILVQVSYVDLAATVYQVIFYYVGQGGGLLKMKNQKGVYWLHSNVEPIYPPQFK